MSSAVFEEVKSIRKQSVDPGDFMVVDAKGVERVVPRGSVVSYDCMLQQALDAHRRGQMIEISRIQCIVDFVAVGAKA